MRVALPRAAEVLAPLLAVATALLVAGLVVLALGESPVQATAILLRGALGSAEGIGYTLYYATSFVFAGLAVAVALHAGLFNIGAEGQAALGGLGVALATLVAPLPGVALLPLGVLAAFLFGAAWAMVPGWLQARRGSHVVITTIMFNWLATTLLGYLLVHQLRQPGSMQPETAALPAAARMPKVHDLAAALGGALPASPLNLSALLALAAALGVWLLVWRTRLGYEMRVLGASPPAARYAGIPAARVTVLAMSVSGGLAGLVAVNEVMGVQERLVLDFTGGAGFVGIAVALMGRAHPFGIVLAALLFGALTQGGAELAFERPAITRDVVVLVSGLVVLFAGALGPLFRRPLARLAGAGEG